MHATDLARNYGAKTDRELEALAQHPDQLTLEARSALEVELTRRRIEVTVRLAANQDDANGGQPLSIASSTNKFVSTRQFIAEVIRVYHANFWLFLRIITPGVIIGYIIIQFARWQISEIARQSANLGQLHSYRTGLAEMFVVRTASILADWTVFCIAFAVIAAVVRQVASGGAASTKAAWLVVRERLGPLLHLSLCLFSLAALAQLLSTTASSAILFLAYKKAFHLNTVAKFIVSYLPFTLAFLALSRFGLAIPALILDNRSVSAAMFRSDELTENKWPALLALLAKSVAGGYVAGMSPFWLATLIRDGDPIRSLFPWLLPMASIAAVSAVEPPMFIGFALLYLKMTSSSSPTDAPSQQTI